MNCDVKAAILPDSSEIAELREGACPVDWALACIARARLENCGISVMCRDGMTQLLAILTDITTGKGESDDISLVRELCEVISTSDGCEIARKAAGNVLFSIERYAEAWDLHCRRKRCEALVCKSYYSVYIDPSLCTGCGKCVSLAPEGAVAGGEGLIHVVKNDAELKTPEFMDCCPVYAIKKAGAVRPKTPDEPVAAGSFSGETVRRRRRL